MSRIKSLYDTLGAPGIISNRCIELFEMKIIEKELETNDKDNIKYAVIALSNMIMLFNWSNTIYNLQKFSKRQNFITTTNDKFINDFNLLNGLYYNLLENGKIINYFTHNDKNFLISHTGIPPYLSNPLGFAPKSKTTSILNINSLLEFIKNINDEKDKCINDNFNTSNLPLLLSKNNELLNNDILIKYIHLSASTGIKDLSDYYAGSYFSTFYGYFSNNIKLHPFFIYKDGQYGGNKFWYDSNDIKKYANMRLALTDLKIDFNIFGHQPQGLFPTAIKQDNTTHVCLDISMINRNSHIKEGTYAYMSIKNNISILGKFKFPIGKTFNINYYSDNANLKLPDFIKYDIDINTFINNNKVNEDYGDNYENFNIDSYKNQIPNFSGFNLLNKNEFPEHNIKILFAFTKKYQNYCFYEPIRELQVIARAAQSAEGGKNTKKKYTKTPEKLKIGNRNHVIYVGSRGAQYIKKNNSYINIRTLKK